MIFGRLGTAKEDISSILKKQRKRQAVYLQYSALDRYASQTGLWSTLDSEAGYVLYFLLVHSDHPGQIHFTDCMGQ